MSAFAAKGWCPDAWHPMMAGDGLLVRVKPRFGRLTREQMLGLCHAAIVYGNGQIDMTRRANLQIRGVTEDDWLPLLDRLVALGLADADAALEKRCNILVAPDWKADDDSHRVGRELLTRLGELPELSGKVGFVVDAGVSTALSGDPGDFRIERGDNGGLILRADGRPAGITVTAGNEVDALIALARWFVDSGGVNVGRMVRHRADLPDWAKGSMLPAPPAARIVPGSYGSGTAYGLPFGRVGAQVLVGFLAQTPGLRAIRITPWRILLAEEAAPGKIEGLLHEPEDLLLRADACPGAPHCPQATVETRDLARRISPHVAGRLHVSGCAKSCACARAADITLTGRDGHYDLSLNARAGSLPARSALNRAEVLAYFGAA